MDDGRGCEADAEAGYGTPPEVPPFLLASGRALGDPERYHPPRSLVPRVSLPMAKEDSMKLPPLVLLAAITLAGSAIAQTPSETAPKMDKACKDQIKKLCGHAHGQEMQDCVKAGVDMNKFSADCTSAIKAKAQKSKS